MRNNVQSTDGDVHFRPVEASSADSLVPDGLEGSASEVACNLDRDVEQYGDHKNDLTCSLSQFVRDCSGGSLGGNQV